jgi:hypothetical protein
MNEPEQKYGLTRVERQLAVLLTVVGWLTIVFAVAGGVLQGVFETGGFAGGLLVAETAVTGVVLLLGSSGLRQNRAALELGYLLFFISAVGWLLLGLLEWSLPSLLAGAIIVSIWVVMVLIRRRAIRARFGPRFLNLRQFETMVQIADAMIDGDGDAVLSPIEIAGNVDRALEKLETPLRKDILLVLFIVEWVLPLISIGRPFTFSALGTNDRRQAVAKVIAAHWLFRDVARFLKVLSCIGYYGTPEAMRSVGYVPFEERVRGTADQTPAHYADPLPLEVRTER